MARLLATLSLAAPSAAALPSAAPVSAASSLATSSLAASSLAASSLATSSLAAGGLGVLSLALSSGCNRPQPPTVTPYVVRVARVGPGGIDLEIELQVYNPNSFPLAAETVAGTLYGAQNLKLGEGRSNPRDAIPSEGSGIVSAELHVAWENLTAIAPLLVSEHVPIEFRGDVTFGGDSLHLTLPFTLTGDLTRAQLLQAGLRGL